VTWSRKLTGPNRRPRTWLLTGMLLLAGAACSLGVDLGDDGGIATTVAQTLTAVAGSSSATSIVDPSPTAAGSATPAPSETAPPSPTLAPPAGGVSLNCDDSYQRFRLVDGGAAGKTVYLDNWNGSSWIEVWSMAGGDPMIRQIQSEVGLYAFGGCQQLIVVPVVYSGSGAILELSAYQWMGAGVAQVYQQDGAHGSWQHQADALYFEQSVYLFGEPNCCPCNRQAETHTWNGAAFIATSSSISPTYSGTPPPICVP